jgi:dipeptidyl aminopeptidase/acylaminoacyl peptidase
LARHHGQSAPLRHRAPDHARGPRLTTRLPAGTRPELFGRISWSPDGQQLAFAAETGKDAVRINNPRDIFVVDTHAQRIRRLTSRGNAFAPRWSPDGHEVLLDDRPQGAGFATHSQQIALPIGVQPSSSSRLVRLMIQ